MVLQSINFSHDHRTSPRMVYLLSIKKNSVDSMSPLNLLSKLLDKYLKHEVVPNATEIDKNAMNRVHFVPVFKILFQPLAKTLGHKYDIIRSTRLSTMTGLTR